MASVYNGSSSSFQPKHGLDVVAGRRQQDDLLSRTSNADSVLDVWPLPSYRRHSDSSPSAIVSTARDGGDNWTDVEADQIRCSFVIRWQNDEV